MGAIFHNGKPYGGGGILNIVTKSWSDYNALSLAEQNDSTKWYFVPDAPASGVPNIVKSVRDNITDAYDPESTYNKDDWCIYDNKLYICTTNNTTGEWGSTKWTRKNLEEMIGSLNSALGGVSMVVLGPDDFTINSDIISFKNATYAAKVVGAHIVTTGGYYATGIRSVNGVKTLRAAQANTTGASILSSLANIVSVLVFLQN